MEIIIGLIALACIIFLVTRKKEVEEANAAPYKVEAPVAPVTTVKVPNLVVETGNASKAKPKAKAPAKPRTARKPAAKAPVKAPVKAKAPAKPRTKKTPAK